MRFLLVLSILLALVSASILADLSQQVAKKNKPPNSTSLGSGPAEEVGQKISTNTQTNITTDDDHSSEAEDEEELPQLDCRIEKMTKIEQLDQDCLILKLYNQSQVDSLSLDELFNVTEHCACQLTRMDHIWVTTFFGDASETARRVANMVEISTRNSTQPVYLWSDADVTLYGVSIYTATNDFFQQQSRNVSMSINANLRRRLERDEIWVTIRRFCRQIARDSGKLYRYMENLIRANPNAFYKLINFYEPAEIVYMASKACKVLMMLKLRFYKLRPDNFKLVPVDYDAFSSSPTTFSPNQDDKDDDQHSDGIPFASQDDNEIQLANNIDRMLKDSSALLIKCSTWQRRQTSIQDLARECPMMMSEQFPKDWMRLHPSKWDRTQVAIKCGCQLLLHKATWSKMMEDSNVALMSKALTDYLNRNRVPDFASTPIFSIHGWFEYIMAKFAKNRKMSIKEMVKAQSKSQDPLTVINKAISDAALERMRVGCNYIMFNYNKGSKEAVSELKLIRYLSNLQAISQDPMYVFHLTLQDPNLFKLHALSKMCEPFVN